MSAPEGSAATIGDDLKPVPESEWVWCGFAGHFICASRCRLHLHTRIGNYRISTVGAFVAREGDKEYDTVGHNRWAETFVFRVEGDGLHGEGEVSEWAEIDTRGYSLKEVESGAAELGHMEMCRKYARVAAGLEEEPSWD